MNCYRSIIGGGNGADSTSYTALVNNTPMPTNISGLFSGTTINAECIIGNRVKDCSVLFSECHYLNQPITIGSNVTDCSGMLRGCNQFNSEVRTVPGILNCSNMFSRCANFNQAVTIPYHATNLDYMFNCCTKFNSYVTIPPESSLMGFMFNGCNSFNQSVAIPASAMALDHMFAECTMLNAPITFADNITEAYAQNMFLNCIRFNQNMVIPQNMTYLVDMFNNCINFRPNHVVIKASNANCTNLFRNCHKISSNIYFYGKPRNVYNMLYQKEHTYRVNIFCPDITREDVQTLWRYVLEFHSPISFSPIDNGWYNNVHNIYLYYNYTPEE